MESKKAYKLCVISEELRENIRKEIRNLLQSKSIKKDIEDLVDHVDSLLIAEDNSLDEWKSENHDAFLRSVRFLSNQKHVEIPEMLEKIEEALVNFEEPNDFLHKL